MSPLELLEHSAAAGFPSSSQQQQQQSRGSSSSNRDTLVSPPLSATVGGSSASPTFGFSANNISSSSVSSSAAAPPVSSSSSSCWSQLRSLYFSLFQSPRHFSFSHWLHLYPVNYDRIGSLFLHRFPAAEDGMVQSGMEKPKKELGFVQVRMELSLNKSLAFDYCRVDPRRFHVDPALEAAAAANPALASAAAAATTNAMAGGSAGAGAGGGQQAGASPPVPSSSSSSLLPLPPSHRPVLLRPEEPLEFHKTVFKKNVRRLKRWLEMPLWFRVACGVYSWRNPLLTFYALALWSYICFVMPAWQFPIVAVSILCAVNVWAVRFEMRVEMQLLVHAYTQVRDKNKRKR